MLNLIGQLTQGMKWTKMIVSKNSKGELSFHLRIFNPERETKGSKINTGIKKKEYIYCFFFNNCPKALALKGHLQLSSAQTQTNRLTPPRPTFSL